MKRLLLFVFLMTVMPGGGIADAADLRLVILDVGMGQSVLLVEDGHGLLIDTGLAEYGVSVSARLQFHGVRSLDYLLLSHLHRDHAAGYFQIREAWPDTPVFDNCFVPEKVHPNEEEAFFTLHAALVRDPLRKCLTGGDSLPWRGHELQVLWPVDSQGTNLNRHSLVLLFSSKQGGRLLVMGDVDKTVERRMIQTLRPLLQKSGIDLYVAAHHAAMDSSDSDFLSLLQPRVSLVSVGRNNPYGYPSDESMAVLAQYSGTVLRTDKDGEICFEWDAKTFVPCTLASE
jgi:competence protein ComEC